MRKLFLGVLIASLFITSCKNDDPDPSPAAEKFITTTNGSTWNYKTTNNTTSAITTYTQTSSNRDTTADGRSYHVYENSNGTNNYMGVNGNDYYTLQVFNLGGADTTLANLYLKDNAATGAAWTQNYSLDLGIGIPINVAITNTIQEKGITRMVNSTNYSNVIHIVTTISIPALATFPGSTFTTNINYYYAPKYGLIDNNAKIDLDVPGVITQHTDTKTELQSATIL